MKSTSRDLLFTSALSVRGPGVTPFPSRLALRAMSRERRNLWLGIAEDRAREASCPNFAQHNDRALGMPDGYMAREAWWKRQRKTHRQQRCSGCGTLSIWTRKGRP